MLNAQLNGAVFMMHWPLLMENERIKKRLSCNHFCGWLASSGTLEWSASDLVLACSIFRACECLVCMRVRPCSCCCLGCASPTPDWRGWTSERVPRGHLLRLPFCPFCAQFDHPRSPAARTKQNGKRRRTMTTNTRGQPATRTQQARRQRRQADDEGEESDGD